MPLALVIDAATVNTTQSVGGGTRITENEPSNGKEGIIPSLTKLIEHAFENGQKTDSQAGKNIITGKVESNNRN